MKLGFIYQVIYILRCLVSAPWLFAISNDTIIHIFIIIHKFQLFPFRSIFTGELVAEFALRQVKFVCVVTLCFPLRRISTGVFLCVLSLPESEPLLEALVMSRLPDAGHHVL